MSGQILVGRSHRRPQQALIVDGDDKSIMDAEALERPARSEVRKLRSI
jgi:hypothetical protein